MWEKKQKHEHIYVHLYFVLFLVNPQSLIFSSLILVIIAPSVQQHG